ncbi:hypothetical protein Tco_0011653 [Tanacetum coccineum]
MAFLTAVASSRFPLTHNQLRTSSNLRNQATIQDDRVTMQQVQGRQGQSYADNSYKGNAMSFGGNNAGGQARVVKCYNCQCEDEEQLAFLADPGIPNGKAVQTTIPNTAAFQTEDLDAYDSDYDDVSNAKAILMANLSNYGSDVISEATVQDNNLYVQQDSKILSVIDKISEQMINHVNNWEKKAQWIKPTLYDGSVISSQHVASPVIDDEERLILEELQTLHPNTDQSASLLVKIEAPKELPKVSLVNTSLKKLKYHLGQFDTVVKKQITPDAITKGEWGFEHTKAVF